MAGYWNSWQFHHYLVSLEVHAFEHKKPVFLVCEHSVANRVWEVGFSEEDKRENSMLRRCFLFFRRIAFIVSGYEYGWFLDLA